MQSDVQCDESDECDAQSDEADAESDVVRFTVTDPFRKALITGLPCKPRWSELSDKIRFLSYIGETDMTTQKQHFRAYAYADGSGMRLTGWQQLFPGAEILRVSEFEDCERYCSLKAKGRLSTVGEPLRKDLRKDAVKGKKKRKVCHRCQLLEAEIQRLKQKCQRLRDENVAKDVYCKKKVDEAADECADECADGEEDKKAEEAKQNAERIKNDKAKMMDECRKARLAREARWLADEQSKLIS